MGCAASKQDEEDNVVSLCKERKRLLKLAMERRYALADAQCKYNQSLYAVAMAIRLFVARHSSHPSPLLITFRSNSGGEGAAETILNSPMRLQRRPTEPTYESVLFHSPKVEIEVQEQEQDREGEANEDESEEESDAEVGMVCEHFYGGTQGPAMPSPHQDYGWDFFNPFDGMRVEVVSGFVQSFDEDLRLVREEEGIPELEDDGERETTEVDKVFSVNNGDECHEVSGVKDVSKGNDEHVMLGERSLRVIDTPTDGRELLEALKDMVEHFVKAYDSGLDVSRMLEANRLQLQSGLEDIKENSNKLIQSITWSRSTSTRSSSCKSLLTSSSKSSSTWTEFKNDLFDDYGGMESGNHLLTIERLYAWEKKLYDEVKTGEQTSKIYARKCSHLRKQDPARDGLQSKGKTRAEVKDLHARILVAIRRVESISERIEKLRDEELHPQLVELLHGLMRNWKIMLESHEIQNQIMLEVKSFNCPAYGKFCNDSHRIATLQLEAELHNWRACLAKYVSTQKMYIEALSGWLSKFVAPEVEFYTRGRSSVPPCSINGPTLLVICHDWLACLEKLPDRAVMCAMKSFGKDIRAVWVQQGEEQQQKRKVDGLAKELDRSVLAFQRAESKILESKLPEQELEVNVRNRIEYLVERKSQLDNLRDRLESEKAKHLTSMQETQKITINGFQTGFSSVFESLVEFSKAAVKMYADLVTYSENTNVCENVSEPPYI